MRACVLTLKVEREAVGLSFGAGFHCGGGAGSEGGRWAGGERVKAENQGEFHDAHTSCPLKFLLRTDENKNTHLRCFLSKSISGH